MTNSMTFFEALNIYWKQMSKHWNAATQAVYWALYLQLIESFRNDPIDQIEQPGYVTTIFSTVLGSEPTNLKTKPLGKTVVTYHEHLLRHLFRVIAENAGFSDPFENME